MSKYMQVKLQEITRAAYYKARTGELLAQRPLGFIAVLNNQRVLFLADGGKFYRGDLLAYHTDEMFMTMQFNEVQKYIAAQFVEAESPSTEEDAAA